ncbi:hypothetical protein [Myxococcus sp. AB056]|uniref:hypothetical protein n=1 Tax=Myxococcus sp. AB056 TaxID=2562792 RepID=UPI0011469FB0|nr:hypothetical protein [Myxococcus sp. AB056]
MLPPDNRGYQARRSALPGVLLWSARLDSAPEALEGPGTPTAVAWVRIENDTTEPPTRDVLP